MNETPQNIWNRPWRGPRLLLWFGLLTIAVFLIICCISLMVGNEGVSWEVPSALFAAVIVAAMVLAGLVFIPWACRWRNLRRLLFGVACVATLVALAYAEENWRGKRAWEKHVQQLAAKGEKFALKDLIPPAVPNDKNFALTPLLAPIFDYTQEHGGLQWRDTNGLARLDRLSYGLPAGPRQEPAPGLGKLDNGSFVDLAAWAAFYRGNTNYPQAAADSSPANVVLTALGKFDPDLVELRQAAVTRPYSRFPIEYEHEPSWSILLPHLARVKGLTTLTQLRAAAGLEAGKTADAFEDLKLGLRLSDSIREEPLLIDHLVRIACLAIDLQTLREGLPRHAWTDPQLAEIETNLAGVNLLAEYEHAMEGERALSVSGLDYLRRVRSEVSRMGFDWNNEGLLNFEPGFFVMPGGWYYQNMATISRMHEVFSVPSADPAQHRVFPEISERGARTVRDLPHTPFTIFARLLLPAVEKVIQKSARMQTYVDAARTACALERFRLAEGKLPESLEALVPGFLNKVPTDVIDGKPLHWKHESDGAYTLYSVGWNQKDDGGQMVPAKNTQKHDTEVSLTEGDWVWSVPAGPRPREARGN